MSSSQFDMEHLSLYELNKTIGEVLSKNLEPSYWVVAEIGQMQTNQKGHCYLELVEKEDTQIKAKTRATIWSYTYRNLSTWFQGITGQELKPGLKILFNATVQYHEIYGFSLNIRDIDAQYTLGERAKKRQEIIARLQEDGVFNMNAELELPIVPQRLAVISSETAAGFGDFMDQLNSNEFGYSFEVKLFNSVMQGDQAEPSIIASLHQIFESIEAFDLVVLIRGGGASLDLDCFDSYELASHIAQFPLPVITGIGHERDETIADLVAHSKMKTPTAVAEFVISGCRNFEMSINEKFDAISGQLNAKLELERSIIDHHIFGFQRAVQQKIYDQNNRLQSLAYALNIASEKAIQNQELKLHSMEHVVMLDVQQYLSGQSKLLDHYAKELTLLDPENVLKRGYSITLVEGKNINNISRLVKGAKIKTITRKLEIDSRYEQSKKRQ